MRKTKIYLDTSVISHLSQEDSFEKMNDTLRLWEEIKAGFYDVYISDVTFDEIDQCYEPKRTLLFSYLGEIDCSIIEVNNEIRGIAQSFVAHNILTEKSIEDCLHVACSIANDCDMIVSWNFKHIVNMRMQKGVKIISALTGYKETTICTPTFLVEGDESSEQA